MSSKYNGAFRKSAITFMPSLCTMTARFRIPDNFAQRLQALKVPLNRLLHAAGLPPGFFRQEKTQVDTAGLFALWRAIGEVSGDPAIGLRMGSEPRTERFTPTAIAAVCSRNFGDEARVSRAGQVHDQRLLRRRDGRLCVKRAARHAA